MPSEEPFYWRYKSILMSFQQILKSEAVTTIEECFNVQKHVGWVIFVQKSSPCKLNSKSMAFGRTLFFQKVKQSHYRP
jgi:hypothetical protein